MKKGQGAQFNWIFVLVAGGIVLGFFVMFTFRYVDLENKKNTVEIGRHVVEGLNILETTQLDTTIDLIYYSDLRFDCETSKLVINDYYPQVLDNVFFSPSSIKSNRLNAWVKTWDYPFKVSNFLYISSPYDNYALVDPPAWVDIPERMNARAVKRTGIKNATKVVFFTMPTQTELKGIRERVIVISDDKIRFFDEKGYKDVDVLDDVFRYGAIFSDNADDYECGYGKALERLRKMARIYSNKAYVLSIIDNRNECDYGFIRNQLNKVSEGVIDRDFIKGLEEQNMDLVGRGCYNVF